MMQRHHETMDWPKCPPKLWQGKLWSSTMTHGHIQLNDEELNTKIPASDEFAKQGDQWHAPHWTSACEWRQTWRGQVQIHHLEDCQYHDPKLSHLRPSSPLRQLESQNQVGR